MREIHTACRQRIQIRRLQEWMSVHANAVTAVLIRHNHQNIRSHVLCVFIWLMSDKSFQWNNQRMTQ